MPQVTEVSSRPSEELQALITILIGGVIAYLSKLKEVTAIFIGDHDTDFLSHVHFSVVVMNSDSEKNEDVWETMNQHAMRIQLIFPQLRIDFNWEIWEEWRRQDSFSGTKQIWLRPR